MRDRRGSLWPSCYRARCASSRRGNARLWCAAMVGVLDTDSGFIQVLVRRLDAAGLQHRVIGTPPSHDALVALRLSALVIDPAVLGPAAGSYLETVCVRMPNLGLVVCTAPVAVAQRLRGLRLGADDWLAKPCIPRRSSRGWRASCAVARSAARAPSRGRSRSAACRSGPTA